MITQPTYEIKMVTNKSNPLKATNIILGHYKIGTEAKLHGDLEDNTCDKNCIIIYDIFAKYLFQLK